MGQVLGIILMSAGGVTFVGTVIAYALEKNSKKYSEACDNIDLIPAH